jgi:hypothetical protein
LIRLIAMIVANQSTANRSDPWGLAGATCQQQNMADNGADLPLYGTDDFRM